MYSHIEHLARSLWLGRFDWSNRMAMYSAFFDESGHPDDGTYLVVAGCVADVEQWVHFEREWKDALSPWALMWYSMQWILTRARNPSTN